MFKETNILKSEKSIDLDSNDIVKTMNKHQRSEIKVKLMEKYNLPSDAAERIIDTLEEKNKIKLDTNENLMKDKNNNTHHEIDSNIEKNFFVSKNNLKHTSEETNTKSDNIQKDHMNYDVDSIITGIVPDYKQNISIEVEHVDLTFEVTSEKVDTIKERVIRSLKGKKSEKTKIHALDDISFKIYQGEKVGIIGYNGAGKSTLLNVISGIYPPDTGFVKTSGKISPLLSLGAGFDMNYTGRKNILLNGKKAEGILFGRETNEELIVSSIIPYSLENSNTSFLSAYLEYNRYNYMRVGFFFVENNFDILSQNRIKTFVKKF